MEYITTVYNPSLFVFLRNVVICFFNLTCQKLMIKMYSLL